MSSIDISRLDMPRDDAVAYRGRYIVPTTADTKWICDWAQFRATGGIVAYSEDQTQITLHLPVGYKFSVGFNESIS